MRTAGVYCRISQDRDGEALGVNRQRTDCLALAQRLGWTVGNEYVDNDTSAYSGKRRPEYERMLADLRTGAIDAVIAWHPDRLHRSPRELEDFIDLIEATRAPVATCTAGDIDLSTPDGRLMARITGSVARKESEDKSRRLRRKHLEIAENGMPSGGGVRPFGYEPDKITLRPDEAREIRNAAHRFLAGDSLRSIVLDWNTRGVETVKGGKWTQVTVRGVLGSPRIAGLRTHHRKVVGPAVWPAIITPDESARIRVLLSDPSRNKVNGRGARSYLLSGFMVCGGCGAKMITRPVHDARRYLCAVDRGGCNKVGIAADHTDRLVTEVCLHRLDTPEIVARPPNGGSDLLEVVAGLEADLDQLSRDHYVEHLISRSQFLAAQGTLQARLERARREAAKAGRSQALDGLGGSVRDVWPGLSLDRRRAILAVVLEAVTVAPTSKAKNRFDPDRLTIDFRV